MYFGERVSIHDPCTDAREHQILCPSIGMLIHNRDAVPIRDMCDTERFFDAQQDFGNQFIISSIVIESSPQPFTVEDLRMAAQILTKRHLGLRACLARRVKPATFMYPAECARVVCEPEFLPIIDVQEIEAATFNEAMAREQEEPLNGDTGASWRLKLCSVSPRDEAAPCGPIAGRPGVFRQCVMGTFSHSLFDGLALEQLWDELCHSIAVASAARALNASASLDSSPAVSDSTVPSAIGGPGVETSLSVASDTLPHGVTLTQAIPWEVHPVLVGTSPYITPYVMMFHRRVRMRNLNPIERVIPAREQDFAASRTEIRTVHLDNATTALLAGAAKRNKQTMNSLCCAIISGCIADMVRTRLVKRKAHEDALLASLPCLSFTRFGIYWVRFQRFLSILLGDLGAFFYAPRGYRRFAGLGSLSFFAFHAVSCRRYSPLFDAAPPAPAAAAAAVNSTPGTGFVSGENWAAATGRCPETRAVWQAQRVGARAGEVAFERARRRSDTFFSVAPPGEDSSRRLAEAVDTVLGRKSHDAAVDAAYESSMRSLAGAMPPPGALVVASPDPKSGLHLSALSPTVSTMAASHSVSPRPKEETVLSPPASASPFKPAMRRRLRTLLPALPEARALRDDDVSLPGDASLGDSSGCARSDSRTDRDAVRAESGDCDVFLRDKETNPHYAAARAIAAAAKDGMPILSREQYVPGLPVSLGNFCTLSPIVVTVPPPPSAETADCRPVSRTRAGEAAPAALSASTCEAVNRQRAAIAAADEAVSSCLVRDEQIFSVGSHYGGVLRRLVESFKDVSWNFGMMAAPVSYLWSALTWRPDHLPTLRSLILMTWRVVAFTMSNTGKWDPTRARSPSAQALWEEHVASDTELVLRPAAERGLHFVRSAKVDSVWWVVTQHRAGHANQEHSIATVDGRLCWSVQTHTHLMNADEANELTARISDKCYRIAMSFAENAASKERATDA